MSLPFKELLYIYLLGLWVCQLLIPQGRFFLVIRQFIFGGIGLLMALLGYSGYLLYGSRSVDPLGKFLLPPYISWFDLLTYWFMQFAVEYTVALIAACIVLWIARWLNRRFQERFFYPSEFWLLLLSILYVGHPGWLVFSIFILMALLFLAIFQHRRVSFYYLWLPVSALTLVATPILVAHVPWVKKLVFHT